LCRFSAAQEISDYEHCDGNLHLFEKVAIWLQLALLVLVFLSGYFVLSLWSKLQL
jgi:hypothetical protein